jgi:hypothetical protein
MNTPKISLPLLGFLVLISCNPKDKEKELEKREKELANKEKIFAEKEADYQALLKMKDSIFSKNDTTHTKSWPESIKGNWTAKSVCAESSCGEYTLGDNRIENWDFRSDSLQLYTLNTHNKSTKLFNAKWVNKEIVLDYHSDSAAKRNMKINVVLNDISSAKMKGWATVTLDNQCNAKFNVELNRNK